jgi:hypothetical protein
LLLCLARLPEPRGGRDRERITDEVTADEVSPTLGGVLEMEQTGKKPSRTDTEGAGRKRKKKKKERGKKKREKGKREEN